MKLLSLKNKFLTLAAGVSAFIGLSTSANAQGWFYQIVDDDDVPLAWIADTDNDWYWISATGTDIFSWDTDGDVSEFVPSAGPALNQLYDDWGYSFILEDDDYLIITTEPSEDPYFGTFHYFETIIEDGFVYFLEYSGSVNIVATSDRNAIMYLSTTGGDLVGLIGLNYADYDGGTADVVFIYNGEVPYEVGNVPFSLTEVAGGE